MTGCDVLAYSCAAARELHPLPCLRHKAKTRKPKDVSKNGKSGERNLLGRALEVNRRGARFLANLAIWGGADPISNTRWLSHEDQAAIRIVDVELGHAVIPIEQIADAVTVFERSHALP